MSFSIILSGPTAVGKTNISILLAKKLNLEIISVDSTQIYKELDIATAKITKDQMQQIKHHLIDIKDPLEEYSVVEFLSDINKLLEKNVYLIVGGTGLYVDALNNGISDVPSKDENLRNELSEYSIEKLQNILKDLDENAYNKIDIKNKRRLIRAIEIIKLSNLKLEDVYLKKKSINHKFLNIYLTRNREDLYNRINKRVDLMIENGLLDEGYKLYSKYKDLLQYFKPIGYKSMYEYFTRKITYEKMIEDIKKLSRHYAKRQITWFKNKGYIEINLTNTSEKDCIELILKEMKKLETE